MKLHLFHKWSKWKVGNQTNWEDGAVVSHRSYQYRQCEVCDKVQRSLL